MLLWLRPMLPPGPGLGQGRAVASAPMRNLLPALLAALSVALPAALPAAAQAPLRAPEQLSCLVEPSRRVLIASAVPGIARRVEFERGDMVRAGATLLELHNDVERAALALAQERAEFARRRLGRNREVIQRNLLSGQEMDELRTEARIAELEINRARAELERRTTLSPISGLVLERRISVGEFVNIEPVAELIALDPLHVELVLRAEAFGTIREGMQALLQLAAPVNATRSARVAIVDRAIDSGSGTFRVRLLLANADLALPSGVGCRLLSLAPQAG